MGNVPIVRSLVDRINARELDSLGDLVDNDIVAHYGSGPAITGVNELDVIASGDIVIMRSTSRCRHTGEFPGITGHKPVGQLCWDQHVPF